MLVTSHGLNSALKIALHGPRPYWVDPNVQAWSTEPSFGMPSGHAPECRLHLGPDRTTHPQALGLSPGRWHLLINWSLSALSGGPLGDVLVGCGVGAVLLGSSIKARQVMEEKIGRMNLARQILAAAL